jgi:DNA-binding MarR family transcriptional regulator
MKPHQQTIHQSTHAPILRCTACRLPVAKQEKPPLKPYDPEVADPSDAEFDEAARLRVALRRFLRQSESITRRHGLSPRHYELLLMIRASVDGRSTVSELVELLQLTQSTVTELVQRAEEGGLLQRRQSPDDGRIVHLTLTEDGERRVTAGVAELGPERARLLDAIQRG